MRHYLSDAMDGSFDEEGDEDEDEATECNGPSRAVQQQDFVDRGARSPTRHSLQTLINTGL
jgi:hypothetical protein